MRRVVGFLAFVLVSAVSAAQSSDIPVSNWTVPPFAQTYTGGITTMTDFAPPRAFIAVQPCRVVDTRSGAFPAGFGPPSLSPSVERKFLIPSGPCPGIPAGVAAYSFNVTVVTPAGPGHLVMWPTDSPEPTVSSINFTAGQTIANAVIVPGGIGIPMGSVSVKAGVSGTHLLIDINGYFAATPSATNGTFYLQNDGFNSTASFVNFSTTCSFGCALYAKSLSSSSGEAILGWVFPGGTNSAGVYGLQGGAETFGYSGAGVRGQGTGYGVLGISPVEGVAGSLVNGSGGEVAYGSLGTAAGADPSGGNGGPWGVFAGGNIGATGAKHFLDPHPTDPSTSIAYISLEGPEAGTYFRGRGRFQNGAARIVVPEHFRLVTDPEGLTVQITPIGGMASVGVVRADLNEIVVLGSRNLEFYYFVHGVRATYKDVSPLRHAGDFRPRSPEAKMPEWLSPGQKRRLVQNGTYREDGSVNTETARRLGWDRIWQEQQRPSPIAPE